VERSCDDRAGCSNIRLIIFDAIFGNGLVIPLAAGPRCDRTQICGARGTASARASRLLFIENIVGAIW